MATASAVFQRFAQSPSPIAVFPPPHASSNTTALDVPEKQVLVRMYGVEQASWMYLFLVHVTGAVWVTLDPHGELVVLDLADKEFALIPRSSTLPAVGRPFLVFGHFTASALVTLRERAKGVAAVCGGQEPPVFMQLWRTLAQDISSTWFYSDPSFSQFGEEVPLQLITTHSRALFRGHQAFVQAVDPPNPPFWTPAARLAVSDLDDWKAAKYKTTLSFMPDKTETTVDSRPAGFQATSA